MLCFVPHKAPLSFEKCFSKSCICLRNKNAYKKILLSKPYEGFIIFFVMFIESSLGAAVRTHPTLFHHSRTWQLPPPLSFQNLGKIQIFWANDMKNLKTYFYFFIFISAFIFLTRRKATERRY